MNTAFKVYMDKRDITDWVVEVQWKNDYRLVHRSFTLVLKGWESFTGDEVFDIFGTVDESNPRMSLLIREGVIAPDKKINRTISGGSAMATIHGYDRVWLATRKKPRETIVMTPESRFIPDTIEGQDYVPGTSPVSALRRYDGPLGKYRVWTGMRTMHDAAKALAQRAGFSLSLNLENYPMQSKVYHPAQSYWDNVLGLLRPFSAQFLYRRDRNHVIAYDPNAQQGYAIGRTMLLGEKAVKSISGDSVRYSKPSRIIVTVPSCL